MLVENLDIKKRFYSTLNERQRRLYVGQLAIDLGHGGTKIVSESFNIDPKTVRSGVIELEGKSFISSERVRKEGGGRKKNLKRKQNYPKFLQKL